MRRTVDVGVEHADAEAHVAQGDGQVGRDGRLAHAALARGDGDDAGDGTRCGFQLGFRTRGLSALLDDDEHLGARESLPQQRLDLVLDLHRKGVMALGEAQHDGRLAVGSPDMLHETARHEVLSRFGVDHLFEQPFDLLFHTL